MRCGIERRSTSAGVSAEGDIWLVLVLLELMLRSFKLPLALAAVSSLPSCESSSRVSSGAPGSEVADGDDEEADDDDDEDGEDDAFQPTSAERCCAEC